MHVLPRALAASVTALLLLASRAAAQGSATDSLATSAIVATALVPASSAAGSVDVPTVLVPDAAPVAAPSALASGPAITAAQVGVARQKRAAAGDDYAALRREAPHLTQAQALMVAGGAGVLVGAVIGGGAGELLMLGGAAVALYGLYQWTQQ